MTKIICITGEGSHGKSSTVALVHQRLLGSASYPMFGDKIGDIIDYEAADARFQEQRRDLRDFNAILPLIKFCPEQTRDRLIGFICKGDPDVNICYFIEMEISLGARVVVCTARIDQQHNKFQQIKKEYGDDVVEFKIEDYYSNDISKIYSSKQPLVEKIVEEIKKSIGRDYICSL